VPLPFPHPLLIVFCRFSLLGFRPKVGNENFPRLRKNKFSMKQSTFARTEKLVWSFSYLICIHLVSWLLSKFPLWNYSHSPFLMWGKYELPFKDTHIFSIGLGRLLTFCAPTDRNLNAAHFQMPRDFVGEHVWQVAAWNFGCLYFTLLQCTEKNL